MVRVAGENDHGAGRIGLELTRVEFITQSDIEHAGNHGIDAIFRVLVRHQLRAVRRFDPDGVRAGLRRLAHDDGQHDATWKLRERLPIDIVGQNSFENVLPELVRPDFVLLSTLCAAGFLRHTILLRVGKFKSITTAICEETFAQQLTWVVAAGIPTTTTTASHLCRALTKREIGALPDLDNVTVRIADLDQFTAPPTSSSPGVLAEEVSGALDPRMGSDLRSTRDLEERSSAMERLRSRRRPPYARQSPGRREPCRQFQAARAAALPLSKR